MKSIKTLLAAALFSVTLVAGNGLASAHVTVKPVEAGTASFQTFTVNVPNEKTQPTVSVKVTMPAGLSYVTPTQKPGWQINTEKTGSGESATVQSITWSGSSIADGFRDEFTFAAKTPDKAGDLQWKAYQTYADGTVVSWDQASEGDHENADENKGPFSVTKVSADAANTDKHAGHSDGSKATTAANRATYIAATGLVLSLIAIYLSTRKK